MPAVDVGTPQEDTHITLGRDLTPDGRVQCGSFSNLPHAKSLAWQSISKKKVDLVLNLLNVGGSYVGQQRRS